MCWLVVGGGKCCVPVGGGLPILWPSHPQVLKVPKFAFNIDFSGAIQYQNSRRSGASFASKLCNLKQAQQVGVGGEMEITF